MEPRRQVWGLAIGAAIGGVLGAVLFDSLDLEPGALGAGIGALLGALIVTPFTPTALHYQLLFTSCREE